MKKLIGKVKKIPHLFGKVIVLWCVGVATFASVYALRILSHTGHDSAALLGVILAFFGGELMVLCLRTVLNDKKKDKTSDVDAEGEMYK